MKFDSSGNLYVANFGGAQSWGSVTVYALGSGSVSKTITKGIYHPNNLAFDGTGNLYVGTAYTFAGFF
jgi:hypothetical protein